MNAYHFDNIRPFVESMEHTLNDKKPDEILNYYIFCRSGRTLLLMEKFIQDTGFTPVVINCAKFTPYEKEDIAQACIDLQHTITEKIEQHHSPVIILNNYTAMFLEQIDEVLKMLQTGFNTDNACAPVIAISSHVMRTGWKEFFHYSISLNGEYLSTSVSLENLERQKTYERLSAIDAENAKKAKLKV
jgi:hypothetical protein